jgi:hypothetical protein
LALFALSCGGPSGAREKYAGEIASRNIRRGAYVFHHTCAACHRGRVNPEGYAWEPWQMRRQVREGNLVMPPIPTSLVSEEDLEAVLAYLTTIGAVSGELPAAPVWGRPVEPDAPVERADMDGGLVADGSLPDAAVDGGVAMDGSAAVLDAPIDARTIGDATGPLDTVDAARPDARAEPARGLATPERQRRP